MTAPKTHFAPDPNAKPIVKRTKPETKQCLGTLEFDKGRCQVWLPYNPAKRLCNACKVRNAKQGKLMSGAAGGGQHFKRSSSQTSKSAS